MCTHPAGRSAKDEHRACLVEDRAMKAFSSSILRGCIGGCSLVIDAKLAAPFRHRIGNKFPIVRHS